MRARHAALMRASRARSAASLAIACAMLSASRDAQRLDRLGEPLAGGEAADINEPQRLRRLRRGAVVDGIRGAVDAVRHDVDRVAGKAAAKYPELLAREHDDRIGEPQARAHEG